MEAKNNRMVYQSTEILNERGKKYRGRGGKEEGRLASSRGNYKPKLLYVTVIIQSFLDKQN